MMDLKLEPHLVEYCYAAIARELEADTCCKRICALIKRMISDGRREPHDEHLIVLANQLLSETRSFGAYVLALNGHLDNSDFTTALWVGRAMVEHEAMLSEIAAGKSIASSSRPN